MTSFTLIACSGDVLANKIIFLYYIIDYTSIKTGLYNSSRQNSVTAAVNVILALSVSVFHAISIIVFNWLFYFL